MNLQGRKGHYAGREILGDFWKEVTAGEQGVGVGVLQESLFAGW